MLPFKNLELDFIDLYKINHEPANRSQRRYFEKEALKVQNTLGEIEVNFFTHLFNECSNLTYSQIYSYYLDKYIRACNALNKHTSFSFIRINEHHFSNNYKPLERHEC